MTKNLPAIATSERTPTLTRHQSRLLPCEETGPEKIHSYTNLIPLEDCRSVIQEIEKAMATATGDKAAALANILVGTYPARAVNNAEVFARSMTKLFEEYPADIGAMAIDAVTKQLKFLPTRAEVFEQLEKLKTERLTAKKQAERHLAEHERRGGHKSEQQRREEEEKAFNDKHGEAFEAWMKIPLAARDPDFERFARQWKKCA